MHASDLQFYFIKCYPVLHLRSLPRVQLNFNARAPVKTTCGLPLQRPHPLSLCVSQHYAEIDIENLLLINSDSTLHQLILELLSVLKSRLALPASHSMEQCLHPNAADKITNSDK